LLSFGLIPEFIGRLPIVAALEELNHEDLVHVLTEPKNALVKQYEKLFNFSDVTLRFTECALRAIASQAQDKKAGARGLRSIIENAMLETMYNVPSEPDIREVVVSEKTITVGESPLIIYQNDEAQAG